MTTLQVSTQPEEIPATAFAVTSSSDVEVLVLDHEDRLVDTLVRVGHFRALQEDWNSYGSPPPSEGLIRFIEGFLTASHRAFAPFLPVPYAVPVSGGGIKLSWRNGERELELEFSEVEEERTEIEFLRISHGEPVSEGVVPKADGVVDQLTWLIQG